MLQNNIRLGIRQFIPFLLLVLLIVIGMGNTTSADAGDLVCMVPSSSGLSDEGMLHNVHITRNGYIASTDEALLDRAIRLAISGNRHKLKEFIIDNPLVFYLRGNLWAHIEQHSWPGKIKIKLMDFDFSVWTVKEAID